MDSCSFPVKIVKVVKLNVNFVEFPHSLEIPSRPFAKWPQTCLSYNLIPQGRMAAKMLSEERRLVSCITIDLIITLICPKLCFCSICHSLQEWESQVHSMHVLTLDSNRMNRGQILMPRKVAWEKKGKSNQWICELFCTINHSRLRVKQNLSVAYLFIDLYVNFSWIGSI